MIIKKCTRGKTLIEILFKIGFKRQEKGLRIFYIINRKIISKIGICVAKKIIRGSVERNVIKRRIRTAYKISTKKIDNLQFKYLIFLVWETKKIPSIKRIEILMKKILHTFTDTSLPKIISYLP
jgi:ribonuclease P protein component